MPFVAAPDVVRSKAIAAGAHGWLADLPNLIESIEHDWSIEVGAVFGDATEAYVAAATMGDGTEAVLKVLVPRDGDAARHEITVLQLAGGEGCVRLLRSDVDRGALLLERLGPSLHDLGLPIDERHEILCATAQRLWRPAPHCGLPTGAQKGRWLVDHIVSAWHELDRPCSVQAIDHAVACAERRIAAHDDERAVLVHGDVHEWNVLRGHDGYRLVDPDGLLAEAEYDMGIVMREDPVELMVGDPRDRARLLAARTDCDTTAIWEWGVVERVSTGLLAERIGLQPVGRQMLAAAEHIALVHT